MSAAIINKFMDMIGINSNQEIEDYDDINEIFAKYGKSKDKPEIDTNIIINSNKDSVQIPNV